MTGLTTFHLQGTSCQIDLARECDPLLSDKHSILPNQIMNLWKGAQEQGLPAYLVVLATTSDRNVLYDGTNLWMKLQEDSDDDNPLKGLVKALPTDDDVVKCGAFILPCYRFENGKLEKEDQIHAVTVETTDPVTLGLLFAEALNPYIDLQLGALSPYVQPLARFPLQVKVLTAQQKLLSGEFANLFGGLTSEKLDNIKKTWQLCLLDRNEKIREATLDVLANIFSVQADLEEQVHKKAMGSRRSSTPYTPDLEGENTPAEAGAAYFSPPLRATTTE